jgi:hypothetical protein
MVTITDSTLSNNVGGIDGGAIANSGPLTIINSTLAHNGAGADTFGSGGSGGGISNAGILTITNSTLAANVASGDFGAGGGISNAGPLTITNSTLTANAARSGGGISNAGALTITNSTLTANVASGDFGAGGGGLSSGGLGSSVTLQNTILALNTSTDRPELDCVGPITSLGNNLIGNSTGCTITLQSSDLTGDPSLDAFTDDGTPGHGHFPLLQTSRAIDAGNDGACPLTDQLGQPRVGQHCDIGAIEFQPTDTTPPTISITATPQTLWPPNGKLVPVLVSGTITDTDSGVDLKTVAYAVTDEYGLIQPSRAVAVAADGSYTFTIHLQASRNGNDRDGREYIITVYAEDNAGNTGSKDTKVIVPHDQGH